MEKHLIVIDDTGSPGTEQITSWVDPNRVSYCGIFIDANIRNELDNGIENLKKELGIKEFHFREILNQEGSFKYLKKDKNKGKIVSNIVARFSELLTTYKFAIFFSTFTSSTLAENGITNDNNQSIDEYALIHLINYITIFIKENDFEDKFEIIVDGDQSKGNKAGKDKYLEELKQILTQKDNKITYASSEDFNLLQVADYYAYFLNRIQSKVQTQMTDFELQLMESFNLAMVNNLDFIYGLKAVLINTQTDNAQLYNDTQIEERKKNGIYESYLKTHNK